MNDIESLIQIQKESLIQTAMETLLTSSWGGDMNLPEQLYFDIFDGIFTNIARDLQSGRKRNDGYHLTRYYQKVFQRRTDLKQNFHAQLAILGTGRVVLNHFLVHSISDGSADFQEKFQKIQKIFDFTIIYISQWWGQIYQEFRKKDQQLIEELKIVKNGLQRQLNVIYQIIKESPIGMLDCDEEWKVRHWNPRASRLTGFQPADILQKNVAEIFEVRSRQLFLNKIRSQKESVYNLHLHIQRKDGSHFPALVSVSKIKYPEPGNIYYVISFLDISDKTRFQSQIQKIDQLMAISRLTGAMMHDIRNPLNTIGINTELLEKMLIQDYGEVSSGIKDLVAKNQRQIQQLTHTLNHYLMYTHLSDLNMEPIPLNENLSALMEDFGFEMALKKIHLDFKNSQKSCRIMGDWFQIKRVFTNILNNSVDVLNEGGKISVRIFRRKKRVIIRIRDNGPGIPPEQSKKIFNAFYSTKENGDGLGLFVAKEIVTAHNGRIYCHSQPGEWTQFTVSFPIWENRSEGNPWMN